MSPVLSFLWLHGEFAQIRRSALEFAHLASRRYMGISDCDWGGRTKTWEKPIW